MFCYGVPQVFKQTYVTVTNLVEGLVTGSGIFMYLYSVHEPIVTDLKGARGGSGRIISGNYKMFKEIFCS